MTSKHQLSLDIQQTNNCSVFRIYDTSIYTEDLEITCGSLDITPPGFNQPVGISVDPNFDFVITACVLGLQTQGCNTEANTLPDGIYNIKYSVSPNDKVYVEYHYLRTCQLLKQYYYELCKLEMAACEPQPDVKAQLDELRLIKSFIDAATANVEQCNDLQKGIDLLVYAKKRLDRFGNDGCCNTMHCH
jgi:hypothetical protein